MNTIQQRISRVEAARESIEKHCMCLRYEESGNQAIVYLQDGYFPDAVRGSWTNNKGEILEKIAEKLEEIWKKSFPGA